MFGFARDSARLCWGFLYWNLRKTSYRWSPAAHRRCPCQNPSDSGEPLLTGCDATLSWDRPARFRHVCPLLKEAPDGNWRCSVSAAEVRPFWGRAFGFATAVVLTCYLVGAFAATFAFRHLGYPLSFRSVAWPPAWHEISVARARLFLAKADDALARDQIHEGLLSLTLAYQLDPQNYAAGRLLAHVSGAGQPALADATFRQLLRDHPANRDELTRDWYRALLARGDFTAIASLAASRIEERPADTPVWLHALVFASRQTGEITVLTKLLEQPENLPEDVVAVLTLERRLRDASADEIRTVLARDPARPATPYVLYDRARRLIDAGAPGDALALLAGQGAAIPARERISLQLDAAASAGWASVVWSDVQSLLQGAVSPATVELLCAHLIRHPHREVLDLLHERLAAAPLDTTPAEAGLHAALFCAAGASGDEVRLAEAAARLQAITGSRLLALGTARAFFSGEGGSLPIERVVPTLPPMPLQVVYALYERHGRGVSELVRGTFNP